MLICVNRCVSMLPMTMKCLEMNILVAEVVVSGRSGVDAERQGDQK